MASELNLRVLLALREKAVNPLRRISESSGSAAKALGETRNRLRELNAQQNDIGAWRKQTDAVNQAAQALTAARTEVRLHGDAARIAAGQLKSLTEAEAGSAAGLRQLKASRDADKAATAEHKAALSGLKTEYAQGRAAIVALQERMASGKPLTAAQRQEYERLIRAQKQLNQAIDAQESALASSSAKQKISTEAVKQAAGAHRDLTAKLAAGTAQHKQSEVAMASAKQKADRLAESHGRQRQALGELSDKLKSAGINVLALGAHELRLKRDTDQATASLKSQQAELAKVAQREREMAQLRDKTNKAAGGAAVLAGGGAAGMLAGTKAVSGIVSLVKSSSDFEQAMLGVSRQVEGARDKNGQLTKTYYEMEAGIKSMSERVPLATNEIAELVAAGARMGIQGKENLLKFAETTSMTARAFDLPVGEIGESMARLSNLYKIPIKNISQLGDTINWLDDKTLAKGGQIIDVMQRMAGMATTVGMSYRQAAALGGTFLSLGSAPEVAANASNALIRELSMVGDKDSTLASMGMSGADVKKGMSTDAMGTIVKVMEGIKTLRKEQQLTAAVDLFGKEWGDDAAKLAQNTSMLREQIALVNDERAKGSMSREDKARLASIKDQWQLTQNGITNLKSELGDQLKAPALEMITSIRTGLAATIGFVKQHPEAIAFMMKLVFYGGLLATALGGLAIAVASVLGPMIAIRFLFGSANIMLGKTAEKSNILVRAIGFLWNAGKGLLSIFGQGLMGVLRLLPGAFTAVRTAFMVLQAVMMANPIMAIVAGIALAAGLIIANWGPISTFFQGLWGQITAGMAGLPERFMSFGRQIIAGLLAGISGGLGSVYEAITGAGSRIAATFKGALGIKSPSRVFATLGDHTMAGLSLGLQRSGEEPVAAMTNTAQRITAAGSPSPIASAAKPSATRLAPALAMAGAFAAMPAAATEAVKPTLDTRPPITRPAPQLHVAGDTITISISVPGGGAAPDIRKAIEQALADRDRAKASRLRSSLNDLE